MVSPSQDLIDQLNDAFDDPISETITTRYYEPYELTPLMKNRTNNMSFFHLNISSLCIYTEELTTLISKHDLVLDIIEISGCRLELNEAFLNSVQIPEHNFEFTLT